MRVGAVLDEHHGRQIIDVPRTGDLNEPRLLSFNQRFHPLLGFLGVVDLRPGISCAKPICLAIVMRHRVIIFDPVTQHKLGAFLAGFPPGSNRSPRRLPAKVRQHLPGLIQHIPLLLDAHITGVFMTVAVKPNLMSCIANHSTLLWEGLQGMARDEPGRFDVVLVEQLQKSAGTNCPGPDPCVESGFPVVGSLLGHRQTYLD